MKVKIKSKFLFTISRDVREKSKLSAGDVVEVIIRKNSQNASFITFVQKSNQLRLRSSARKKLNIREDEEIDIEIKKLKEISRTNKIIKGKKIDILSLIPEKTRRGFPIRVFENKDKIVILDAILRGHSSEPIIINRFSLPKFCKFLGLVQAEGEKTFNRSGGTAFTFTNIFPSLHNTVLECLYELGVHDRMIKLRILVPESVDTSTQNTSIKNFLELTNINPERVRINKIKEKKKLFDRSKAEFKEFTIRNIVFTIKVERTLLAEIVINAIKEIRKFLSGLNRFDEFTFSIACNFLIGVIMGDGTIGIGKDKNNKTKVHIEIKDKSILHIKECEKIFIKLGFKTSLKEDEALPRLVIYCNWNLLVHVIFKNKMLNGHPFHLIKLLLVICRMTRWIKYKRLLSFDGTITTTKLREDFKLTRQGARLWLRKKEKERLVKGIKNGTRIEWRLTERGKEIQRLLKEIERQNSNLVNTIHTNDFDGTRKILKNINKTEINNRLQLYQFSI